MNNISISKKLAVRYIQLISLLTWISTSVAGSLLNNNLPSKYEKYRNTLVENSTGESHEKDIEEIPEVDKIVFYTEENGKEIKHCIHRDDDHIYCIDLEILKERFDERVEACKEFLYHVGTPELYKLWEPNGGECLDIPKWLIKKTPDQLKASSRDNGSKRVDFLTWLKLAKKGKIDDLDYRHIDKSSVNDGDYNEFFYDEAHEKIPSHYYLRQKHKYDIATGRARLEKIVAALMILGAVGIEWMLIRQMIIVTRSEDNALVIFLFCASWFFLIPLVDTVSHCIKTCTDSTGELARRKYRKKGVEKILFKEPNKWKKKCLCMKKKNFNDKKRHFIHDYTYFNFSSYYLCNTITSYFIKEIPLKPIEAYISKQKHTNSQDLVVGENHQ